MARTRRPAGHGRPVLTGPPRAWLGAALAVVLLTAACASASTPPGADGADGDGTSPPVEEGEQGPVQAPEENAGEGPEPPDDPPDPAQVGANELGEIPVLMYHRVVADGGSQYDSTPEQLRRELRLLHEQGYRPVPLVDVIDGAIDLPAGKSPVVLTFDDSSRSQLRLRDDGSVDPETAVGILLEVADELDDFEPHASFYVLDDPFGASGEQGADLLRLLADLGFEVGNHTKGHVDLRRASPEEARRELALGAQLIRDAIPGAEVRTLALPYGSYPQDRDLVRSGEHDGMAYAHDGVLMVGSGPSPSPFDAAFDPYAIPRIRSQPDFAEGDEPDFGSGYWLWQLEQSPERRYVSDGDPTTISFPSALAEHLDPAFEDRANPY